MAIAISHLLSSGAEVQPLSWFSSNAGIVLPNGKIVYLNSMDFYKVGDGATPLSQLKWIPIRDRDLGNGYSANINYFNLERYDTATNRWAIVPVNLIAPTTYTVPVSDNNVIRGNFIYVKEPMVLDYIGDEVTSVSIVGTSPRMDIGIYSVTFNQNNFIINLITSVSFVITAAGLYRNTTPLGVVLNSGIYFMLKRFTRPPTSSFSARWYNSAFPAISYPSSSAPTQGYVFNGYSVVAVGYTVLPNTLTLNNLLTLVGYYGCTFYYQKLLP